MKEIIQKLLMSEEYGELEDSVLVEGPFIELDKRGDSVRQVILGMTRDHFLVAKHIVQDYKKNPWVIYDTEVDLDLDGMELSWIIPICYLEISQVRNEHVLNVKSKTGRHHYYMISNIGGNEKERWNMWMERVEYIVEDPYGYVRQYYKQLQIPFELYDVETGAVDVLSIDVTPATRRRSRLKSMGAEAQNDNTEVSTLASRLRTRAKSIVPAVMDALGLDTEDDDEKKNDEQEEKEGKHVAFREVGSQIEIKPIKKKWWSIFACWTIKTDRERSLQKRKKILKKHRKSYSQ